MRKTCMDIEERISHITDINRTRVDLHNGLEGAKATRETRMEVVAWIAVCKFGCKLEGGFVRDWIVRKDSQRPAGLQKNPKGWVNNKNGIPYMNEEVVPADLDCHLPSHAYFDIDKFEDVLHKFGIKCTMYRENWRYVVLIDEDEKTGPFTMDLIEPHIALTHDRIDFDVNNLSLEKSYTHELGMRIDIQRKPYLVTLEKIVDNIKKKQFQVLRDINFRVSERINKMTTVRGWTQLEQSFLVLPDPHFKYYAVLVPLPPSSTLYKELSKQMNTIEPKITILSIEQIKNPFLEDAYEAMKKLIAKQCKSTGYNPNEHELFHGTKGDGIKGITEDGFDDRYFSPTGAWGHGAYFADDPRKSPSFTVPNPTDQTRVMYYTKVLLGKQSIQNTVNKSLVSAPVNFHSVLGTHFHYREYIIYRYGQALPYLKIIYKN